VKNDGRSVSAAERLAYNNSLLQNEYNTVVYFLCKGKVKDAMVLESIAGMLISLSRPLSL